MSLCVYKPVCTSRRKDLSSQKLCCCLAALVKADDITFNAAEYVTAGLHVLDSCSYARDLGAVFKRLVIVSFMPVSVSFCLDSVPLNAARY